MASVICDFCGSYIDSTQAECPNCGAPNSQFQRTASDTPRTIEELKAWYASKGLPSEHVTRFFIGRDVADPKAFGIFRDEAGNFVVYKNKADGSRAVRYKGKDEAYAVNEIYLKLKSEILEQKEHKLNNAGPRTAPATSRYSGTRSTPAGSTGKQEIKQSLITILITVIVAIAMFGLTEGLSFMLVVLIIWLVVRKRKHKTIVPQVIALIVVYLALGIFSAALSNVNRSHYSGYSSAAGNRYYTNDNSIYYHTPNNWYYYDREDDDWYITSQPSNYSYYDWDDDYGYQPFEDSSYSWDMDSYDYDYDDYDYDWDSDYDYDYSWSWYDDDDDWSWSSSDSWDSGYDSWDSGWDSDWGSSWDSDW